MRPLDLVGTMESEFRLVGDTFVIKMFFFISSLQMKMKMELFTDYCTFNYCLYMFTCEKLND